ncbi:hypothetical protein OIU85_024486 [Salix viminalis]|uniref:Uncharacterized protein n=1 Tax=Salix viminalis TaxID=40686 RepID=A0A9Q0U0X9_SALVM|nr:hypothetical protein OIU85_024486 [Salix viminalis]
MTVQNVQQEHLMCQQMNPNEKSVPFTSTTAKTVLIATTGKAEHDALSSSGGESTITSLFHKPMNGGLFPSSISKNNMLSSLFYTLNLLFYSNLVEFLMAIAMILSRPQPMLERIPFQRS